MTISALVRVLIASVAVQTATLGALQVHLTFDENVGATAFNTGSTGAANDAGLRSGNSMAPGIIGGGLSFNNTSSSAITAGANPLPGDTLRTISFWINSSQTSGGQRSALSFGTNNNPAGGTSDPGTKFDIDLDTGTGALEVGVGGGRTDSAAATISTPALNDGTWRMATVLVPDLLDDDSAAFDLSDIDIYVDGEFSYSGAANNSADRTVSTDPGGSLFLGRAANSDGFQNIDATLDDVAVWDNPLSADEIKGLYDVGSQLQVNAAVYDQVLTLHSAGAGVLHAGDFSWTYATGLTGSAGVTGSSLVLNDAANTGVTFTALVPGDVDRNGVADLNDFNIITGNFLDSATSRDDGDLNGDGIVDFGDFRIWKDAVSQASGSTAVPEPNGVWVVFLAVVMLAAARATGRVSVAAIGFFVAFGVAVDASAQTSVVYFVPSSGDYNDDDNWDTGFRPEAFLDEFGIIGSNQPDAVFVGAADDATATLSATTLQPAALQLGQGFGAVGRLIVQSGGSITIPGTDSTTQGLDVGFGENGTGFLTIEGGGSVSALTVDLNGPTAGLDESQWSAITLTGDASLTTTTGNMQLNRVINVTGPNATINSAGDLGIGNRGRYFANITGASHTVMTATGNIQLDGVLIPTFSGGATPTEGASWDLFDAATLSGAFDDVRAPGRVPGQGFVIETRPGGNGVIGSLAIRSTLVLEVNRDTGEVQITQPFGSPVTIDAYSIESASGNLGSSTWNSLEAQGVGDWIEANVSPTQLNELKPTTSTQVSGAGLSLGTAYTPDFSVFGQAINEDLVFEYADINTGQVVQGEVIYSGVKVNDLILVVDPATGDAQLRNTSDASVSIDGYQVSSASGSLLTAGWNSLQDQASADWFEAEATSLALAELLPSGDEVLTADSGYNLGAVFSTLGDQDLVLEYFESGTNVLQTGRVLYAELPDLFEGLVGDYNNDGSVDAADYTVWRNGGPLANESASPGVVDGADYDAWAGNYGATVAASSTAVPEPLSASLAMLAGVLMACLSRPSRHVAPLALRPSKVRNLTGRFFAVAAVVGVGASASAQTILFDHDFEDAPNAGSAVTSVGDLGTPNVGSMSFSGAPIGGIGGTRPALAVGFNANGISNMTLPTENSVTFDAIVDPENFSFPETQVADAGSGDRVFADFATPGTITSSSVSTDISFSFGHFGTSNTGSFKHTYIRGLDASDNEVFELLFVAGSGNLAREWYARGPSDDSIELTAAGAGTPEGQLLAEGFGGAFNSTNVAAGRPAQAMLVDISLSNSMVTFDIGSTNGTGTPTAINGMALPINSGATSISRLEFGSVWNANVNGQNNGYWIDDLFATTTPIGAFPIGDVNLDGSVNLADFNIIASNFKDSVSSRTQGDLNEDGFVDFADFRIWKDASTASSGVTVPEPAAGLMLACLLAASTRRRR